MERKKWKSTSTAKPCLLCSIVFYMKYLLINISSLMHILYLFFKRFIFLMLVSLQFVSFCHSFLSSPNICHRWTPTPSLLHLAIFVLISWTLDIWFTRLGFMYFRFQETITALVISKVCILRSLGTAENAVLHSLIQHQYGYLAWPWVLCRL